MTEVATVGVIADTVKELHLDPRARGFVAVLSGHSHQPRAEERDGVLFFNPGSAGPRRFRLPVTVARLTIESGRLVGTIIELDSPVSRLTSRRRKGAAGDRGGARAWR